METPLTRTLYLVRRLAQSGRRPSDRMQRAIPIWRRHRKQARRGRLAPCPASIQTPFPFEHDRRTTKPNGDDTEVTGEKERMENVEHSGHHDPEYFAQLCAELPFREAVETCTTALESTWLEHEHIPEILVKASRPQLYTRGYIRGKEDSVETVDWNKLFPSMLHPAVATATRDLLVKCLPHTPSLDLETTVGLVQLLVRLRWNDDAVALTQHIVKHSNLAFDDVMAMVKLPIKRCTYAEAIRTVRMILFTKYARDDSIRPEDLQALVALLVGRGSSRRRQRVQQMRGKAPFSRVNSETGEEYKYGVDDARDRVNAGRELIESYITYNTPGDSSIDVAHIAPAFITLVEAIIALEHHEALDSTLKRMNELGVPITRTIVNRLIEGESGSGEKDNVLKLVGLMRDKDIIPDSGTLQALCKVYIFKYSAFDCTGLASYIDETAKLLNVEVTPKVLGYAAFEAAKRSNWSETQQIKMLADRLHGNEHTKQQWWYQKLVLLRAFEAVDSGTS